MIILNIIEMLVTIPTKRQCLVFKLNRIRNNRSTGNNQAMSNVVLIILSETGKKK